MIVFFITFKLAIEVPLKQQVHWYSFNYSQKLQRYLDCCCALIKSEEECYNQHLENIIFYHFQALIKHLLIHKYLVHQPIIPLVHILLEKQNFALISSYSKEYYNCNKLNQPEVSMVKAKCFYYFAGDKQEPMEAIVYLFKLNEDKELLAVTLFSFVNFSYLMVFMLAILISFSLNLLMGLYELVLKHFNYGNFLD